jgi:hypothetical protein
MTIVEIAANSQYLTDNTITDARLLGVGNQCIAEINTKVGTKLPLFVLDNVRTTTYSAVTNDWQLRLIEPYVSYAIMANDNNDNVMVSNYSRFLDAIKDFKKHGLKDIKLVDEDDEPTGYEGTSKRSVKVSTANRTVSFFGLDW